MLKNLVATMTFTFSTFVSLSQPFPAANALNDYLRLLKNKKVGLVVNQTSVVHNTHLLDTLLASKVNIVRIFGPEHGFRGKADAGEKVNNDVDAKTGISVVSLYGKNKKPYPEQILDLDIIVFDIQDVGARFYTYISTLHYVMEACAQSHKTLIILDRPNPNGMYIDGPVLDTNFTSFVGLHPIPIVHGLTIGELARMINGEKWLKNGLQCDLEIIKCVNYTHDSTYSLPIKPSPNLPNDLSIALYPSLCLFEGTNISVARGTYFPFQAIGFPDSTFGEYYFIPQSIDGMAKEPVHIGKKCYGIDLRQAKPNHKFNLSHLIDFYNKSQNKDTFFNPFFNKLAGNDHLMQQIKAGISETKIRASWKADLARYKKTRKKYLLYTDFVAF
ncbi:MAG: exo-beta-N-acetylmuramidase NamZ domain-containing protein [Cytophagales bacterium]